MNYPMVYKDACLGTYAFKEVSQGQALCISCSRDQLLVNTKTVRF